MKDVSHPKIGYVIKMFPRLSETFIRNEIRELERQGLQLHIFSLKRPAEAEVKLVIGQVQSPVTYLPERVYREPWRVLRAHLWVLRRHPRGYRRMLSHVLRKLDLGSAVRSLRRFSKTCCLIHELKGIHHLHAHFANEPTRVAAWARMISQVSYSVTTHAKDLFLENRMVSPVLQKKLRQASFVITNSEFSRAGLRASFDGDSPPRIFTIHNSIDLSVFPRRGQEPSQPVIVSAGRLVEKKGFQQLIAACGILKEAGVKFKCEIIGSGQLRAELEGAIQRLGLEHEVRLHGQMSQHELLKHLNQAMVFALPCIVSPNGDRDILPNVLKEAMAVGVPVLTSRIEGIEELLNHEESGILVAPGNAEALAEGIQRLFADAGLRRRLADQARTVIEDRFELSSNFTLLRDLLVEAAQAKESVAQPVCDGENEPHARRVYHN